MTHKDRFLAVIRSGPLWCSPRASGRGHLLEQPGTPEGLDWAWYFRTYRKLWPNAAMLPADSAAHYCSNAAPLFLSPNLIFDEFWYRCRYPEIDTQVRSGATASGWEHYLERGCLEHRNPVWWFDEEWYQSKYSEVGEAVKSHHLACGFEHYLLYGLRQDLSPSLYFDVPWYRKHYLAGDEAHKAPLVDYLLTAGRGTRCPVQFFDPDWYRSTYLSEGQGPDADELPRWQGPYEHYIFWGRFQQSSPSPKFNESAYRELNPGVVEKIADGRYLSGFEHYVHEGAAAGLPLPTHLGTAGVDYAGPAFLKAYEKSLSLNMKQLHTLRRLAAEA